VPCPLSAAVGVYAIANTGRLRVNQHLLLPFIEQCKLAMALQLVICSLHLLSMNNPFINEIINNRRSGAPLHTRIAF
jgi:hypothetical protein